MVQFDILGIGNAIVDVIASVEPSFLDRHGMRLGSMTLIDAEEAEALTRAMPPSTQSSGGSVANTCAVAAQLGARVAFLGKVADDTLGAEFQRDISAVGVHYPSTPMRGQAPTARCLILVTPDGQRTMHTYLGACVAFEPDDLTPGLIEAAAITYLEGYLFDPPSARTAFGIAAERARGAGRLVALSLSDGFCVDRHRAEFHALLPLVDILFANEVEVTSLYQCNTFEDAAEYAARDTQLAVLTRGAAGSVIRRGAETVHIAPAPTRVVDTTGAGDCYAAGFLTAFAAGAELGRCGALGSAAAAACIALHGARPPRDALPQGSV